MAFCINCGNKLDDNFEFCPECGTKVNEAINVDTSSESSFEKYTGKTKICKKCGSKMPEDSFYCLNCGNICIFRKNCASVPEERSAIPFQTEQSSAG